MSIFTNQNFIHQIIKQQGAEQYFDKQCYLVLQTLIQAQTRKMLQKASKYMHNDHRDHLISNDLQNSIKDLGHQQISLQLSQHSQFSTQSTNFSLVSDPFHKDITSLIQSQLSLLSPFSILSLKGRFIYIDKKIPKTDQNYQLKSLEDIKQIKAHQYQQKKKNFNIIRDEPQAQLTKEEIEYYTEVVGYIMGNGGKDGDIGNVNGNVNGNININININGNINNSGKNMEYSSSLSLLQSIQVKGCIINILPLILKFIINLGINQNSIIFILKAIQNKYVWSSFEYNMHQFLIILMSYCGPLSFQVGIKIGNIINRFAQKYPTLYDIFEQVQFTYSNIIKKVGFQLITGIGFQIGLDQIKQIELNAIRNDQMAGLCMKILTENWAGIGCLKKKEICEEYGYVYWYSAKELQTDPYLNMY